VTVKSLLTASLLLSACALPVAAQSNRTPDIASSAAATLAPNPDNVTHIPAMTQSQNLGVAKPASPADIQTAIALERLKESKAKVLQLRGNLAQNEGCFTLRSYGFTADDLKSDSPRPSTSTTCTPASTGKTKQAKAAILVR
jgi:hypothetical protein